MKDNARAAIGNASRAVFYQYSLWDKILGALVALRLRFFRRRILVAGPYVGEFGHELMDWQAWVRAQADRYEEVHVITFPGRDYLYPGCRVHHHDVLLEKAGYRYGRLSPQQQAEAARKKAAELGLKDYDILTQGPLCTNYHRRFLMPAKFELLGKPPTKESVRDVAFHFRSIKKEGPDQARNYQPEACDRLVALCREQGLSLFCVGHPRYSYCPPGVEDRRSEDLETSAAAISSARLLAGELSGPMHLAQLCGVPILIWADGQWRIEGCKGWNVFQVPIYVVANNTHRPDPAIAAEQIVKALKDLEVRTDGFRKPTYRLAQ
jgi:hypothetical protein